MRKICIKIQSKLGDIILIGAALCIQHRGWTGSHSSFKSRCIISCQQFICLQVLDVMALQHSATTDDYGYKDPEKAMEYHFLKGVRYLCIGCMV